MGLVQTVLAIYLTTQVFFLIDEEVTAERDFWMYRGMVECEQHVENWENREFCRSETGYDNCGVVVRRFV